MESHSESMAFLLPELAAVAIVGGSIRPQSTVVQDGVPAGLDFLALLEQQAALGVSAAPANGLPPRQFLPTGGQGLPLPPTAAAVPTASQSLVLAEQPSPKPLPLTLGTASRISNPSYADAEPAVQANRGRGLQDAAQATLRLVPTSVEPPQVAPTPLPELAPRAVRSEPVTGVQRFVTQIDIDPPTQLASNVDLRGDGGGPPGRRSSDLPLELSPEPSFDRPLDSSRPVATSLERFELPQTSRADLTVTSSHSSTASATPMISTSSLPGGDHSFNAVPASPTQDSGAEFQDKVVDSVRWLSDQKGGEMRLRLNPPELGHLEIKVTVKEDQTFVHITANNGNAREVLEQHLGRLRTLLDTAGLSLADAQVSSERHPDQNQPQTLPVFAPTQMPSGAADDDDSVAVWVESSHGVDLFA